MKKILSLIFIVFFTCFRLFSQNYLTLNELHYSLYLKHLNLQDSFFHTTVKPLKNNLINDYSVFDQRNPKLSHKKFFNKIFYDDLVSIQKKDLIIKGNLLFEFWKGKSDTNIYWQNTRGFNIYGTLGKNLTFYTDFYENQAIFPSYILEKINETSAIPGRANWKDFGKDRIGKDFNFSSGFISWDIIKNLNLQLGQYKIFIGEGYRSLFISDNSYSFPNLKINYTKKHFSYNTIYGEVTQYRGRYYAYHSKRHITINILDFSNKFVELALFEGILWHTSDDSTYIKKFPVIFFIPIPFVRLPFLGFENEHNAIIGANLKIKPLKFTELYSQFVYDAKNKYGYQAGLKIYNLFFSANDKYNFYLQAEYNYANPYLYKHWDEYQAWLHYNQALAHPQANDFKELVVINNLKIRNLIIRFAYDYILTDDYLSLNCPGDLGKNLLLPENDPVSFFKPGEKNKKLLQINF